MHAFGIVEGEVLSGGIARAENGLIWFEIRDLETEISVSIVGWVDHRTHVIDRTGHHRVVLSDRDGIDVGADDGSEDVGRHKYIFRCEAIRGEADELGDDVRLIHALGFFLRVDDVIHAAFGTEADVVELDLIEAGIGALLCDLDLIFPGVAVIRVDPGHAGIIREYAAVGLVVHPLRLHGREVGVTEGDDAGDGVDAMLLQSLHQGREVRDGVFGGADLVDQRGGHPVLDAAFIAEDVDHDGIQLGLVNVPDDVLHARGTGSDCRKVDSLDARCCFLWKLFRPDRRFGCGETFCLFHTLLLCQGFGESRFLFGFGFVFPELVGLIHVIDQRVLPLTSEEQDTKDEQDAT